MLRLSSAGDLAHGIVKAQAQDLDEEVDGVAGQFALGPAPVAVFEEQAREGGQLEVACFFFDQAESSLLEQGQQGGHARGADLLAGPAMSRMGHGSLAFSGKRTGLEVGAGLSQSFRQWGWMSTWLTWLSSTRRV